MSHKMMIDFRSTVSGKFIRRAIDDFEFCVREGFAYFSSNGERYEIHLEDISQIYVV